MSAVMSPLGFGMANAGWQASHTPAMPIVSSNPRLKRRLEDEDPRDLSLDPNATSDRPKKANPKRARTTQSPPKESPPTSTESDENNDVDIGVLLASLPSESLLPILTALVKQQPTLKSSILPLIPRPTLDTALEALSSAAKQLRDAYPYSNAPSSQPSPTPGGFAPSFAFRGGFGSFGSATPVRPHSVQSPFAAQSSISNGAMRPQYVQDRIGPAVTKFVGACHTYLPYFSHLPQQSTSPLPRLQSLPISQNICETFTFLFHLTSQILSQPPLAQATLVPMLLPRLTAEWMAWVNRVDVNVNQEAGMFSTGPVTTWSQGLDELCSPRSSQALHELMHSARKRWLSSVGWLVNRGPSPEPMDV